MTLRSSGATTCCKPCTSLAPPVPPVNTRIIYNPTCHPERGAKRRVEGTLQSLCRRYAARIPLRHLTQGLLAPHHAQKRRVVETRKTPWANPKVAPAGLDLRQAAVCVSHRKLTNPVPQLAFHAACINKLSDALFNLSANNPPRARTPGTNSGYTGRRCFSFCPAASVRRCKSSRCGQGASGLM